ncbi:protein phosphatase 1 regulatory subunit 37-like [Serinus canaria]|uniref:protein phosphatase 1 regulatory subunit 37-like n=1 Tax=Serinus canaria TaxID=9135 RepID=UPI0021CCB59C|nr:protein phosphatase 1 regulatory subunit 37-like [Serinus canaria]
MGKGLGKCQSREGGLRGDQNGRRDCSLAVGMAARWPWRTLRGGAEAVGNVCSGAGFASKMPMAAASAGAVPKMRAEGKTRGASGKGSQSNASMSDAGGELGAAAEPRVAPVGRRRRRRMRQDPDVAVRRSARIAERRQAQAGRRLHARAGGVDTTSEEEEERESGTDIEEETSEEERDGDSDVSSGETGGIPEPAQAQKVRRERGRGRCQSPVTLRARRGHVRGSTSRDSTPSSAPASPIPIPAVQTSSIPERRACVQPSLLAHSKPVQTQFQKPKTLHSAEAAEEPTESVMSSRSSRPITAPSSGERTTLQDMPDPVGRATAPSRGKTTTMQHFFPTSYKRKKTTKKEKETQQTDSLSTSKLQGFKDKPSEEKKKKKEKTLYKSQLQRELQHGCLQ